MVRVVLLHHHFHLSVFYLEYINTGGITSKFKVHGFGGELLALDKLALWVVDAEGLPYQISGDADGKVAIVGVWQ